MAKFRSGQSDNIGAVAIMGEYSHMSDIGVTVMQCVCHLPTATRA